MFANLKNLYKVPELRNKLLFTVMVIVIYRIGSQIPVPGIDITQLQTLKNNSQTGGVLQFMQLFSGGTITQFSVFALGIMPYITASIVIQVLTVAVPKLEEWQNQGAVGQRKLTQWTRYITVAICVVQARLAHLHAPQRRRWVLRLRCPGRRHVRSRKLQPRPDRPVLAVVDRRRDPVDVDG